MKTFVSTIKKSGLRSGKIYIAYTFLSIITAFSLVTSYRLNGEMSEAAAFGDTQTLLRMLIIISGLLVIRTIASALATLISARFTAKAGYNLRSYFIKHFLNVPFAVFEEQNNGERLSIYSTDVPKASRFISSGVLDLIEYAISFAAAFGFMIFLSPAYAGILILSSLAMLLFQFLLSRPIQKASVKLSEEKAGFNAVVYDSIQNLSVIAAYSLEEKLEERYMQAYDKYYAVIKNFAKAIMVMIASMLSLLISPLIVVFIVLALAVINGNMSIADLVAFSTTILIAFGSLTNLAQHIGNLMEFSAGAKRLITNTSNRLESMETDDVLPFQAKPSVVTFKNVSFTYNSRSESEKNSDEIQEQKPALTDISFDIPVGSKVAIIGGSGSGKSTVLKLLMGLYEPTLGEITVDDINISKIAKSELREIFSYVPQDSFLFPASIGENISGIFDDSYKNIDKSRLEKACKDAGIIDFINSLPNKFDGILTESAENISGGQRQRIAMARAFYKDAPIILFDEATSSLDPITEAAVLKSLNDASTDKTVIIVSHRASTITACDMVITLNNGKVESIKKEVNR